METAALPPAPLVLPRCVCAPLTRIAVPACPCRRGVWRAGIMRENVEKVLERDQKVTDLSDKAEDLKHGSARFKSTVGNSNRSTPGRRACAHVLTCACGHVFMCVCVGVCECVFVGGGCCRG